MTRRYVHPNQLQEPAPEKPAPEVLSDTISIDELLKRGIRDIGLIMIQIRRNILDSTGVAPRETVQSLKDIMSMLHELKKKEQDVLDSMSDKELEEYLSKAKK